MLNRSDTGEGDTRIAFSHLFDPNCNPIRAMRLIEAGYVFFFLTTKNGYPSIPLPP